MSFAIQMLFAIAAHTVSILPSFGRRSILKFGSVTALRARMMKIRMVIDEGKEIKAEETML